MPIEDYFPPNAYSLDLSEPFTEADDPCAYRDRCDICNKVVNGLEPCGSDEYGFRIESEFSYELFHRGCYVTKKRAEVSFALMQLVVAAGELENADEEAMLTKADLDSGHEGASQFYDSMYDLRKWTYRNSERLAVSAKTGEAL